MTAESKRLISILIGVVLLLCIPLISMQYTSEVKWTILDFVVAGILLIGAGFTCEVAMRKIKKVKHRIITFVGILFGLLIVWLELAVGIFGTPLAGS